MLVRKNVGQSTVTVMPVSSSSDESVSLSETTPALATL
jgi:hypothetical protein